jgi:hypothetical protein
VWHFLSDVIAVCSCNIDNVSVDPCERFRCILHIQKAASSEGSGESIDSNDTQFEHAMHNGIVDSIIMNKRCICIELDCQFLPTA